jgi:hypothetical protein
MSSMHGGQQSTHHTLALFGDQDNFTSAEKLRKWSDEMVHMPCDKVENTVRNWLIGGNSGHTRR